jgi:hypothetical protein
MQWVHDRNDGFPPVLELAELVETYKLEKGFAYSKNFVGAVFEVEKPFFKGG